MDGSVTILFLTISMKFYDGSRWADERYLRSDGLRLKENGEEKRKRGYVAKGEAKPKDNCSADVP